MAKTKSRQEIRTIALLEKCVGIALTVQGLVPVALIWFGKDDKLIQTVIATVAIGVELLIISQFKERFISLGLQRMDKFTDEEEEICGYWDIEITYKEGQESTGRRGALLVEKTAGGLVLRGDSIYDAKTKDEVVEEWISDYVEVTEVGNITYLQYAFRLKRSKQKGFDKVGHVVVNNSAKNPDVFEGKYFDLLIAKERNDDDEKLRDGNVLLRRSFKKSF